MKKPPLVSYLGWKLEYHLGTEGGMTILARKVEGNQVRYICHKISDENYNLNGDKSIKWGVKCLKDSIEKEEDELVVLLHKTLEKNGRN